MVYFFKEKQILYPFSDLKEKYVEEEFIKKHKLVSSLLFFNKNYQKELIFKKELFKNKSITINLYQYKDIFLVEKNHDYSSNEYFIGIYSINLLRSIIPTFTYTYFKSNKKLWLEYNDGITLYDYLKKFKNKPTDETMIKEEGRNYLSIFFQILMSLEVSQEQGLFTHYDFHLENIMINSNSTKKDLCFPIGDYFYSIPSPPFIISILDYEYSCSRYKEKIISSIKPFLFQYGYFSIFFTGIDILRFLFSFHYNFYKIKDTFCIKKIYSFHNFILKEFYKIPVEKIDFKTLDYHSSFFFNLTFSKKIYKTPYDLLLFLQKHDNFIFSIFNIDSLPFSYHKKEIYYKPSFIQPKKHFSLQYLLQIKPDFYTIYKNKKDLYDQYKELINYRDTFEYFYFTNQIPSIFLKLTIRINRYIHSIEQILLLKSLYPSNEYNYFKLNIYKIPYLL